MLSFIRVSSERYWLILNKYSVDSRELIVRVTRENQVDAPDELVERLATELAQEKTSPATKPQLGRGVSVQKQGGIRPGPRH